MRQSRGTVDPRFHEASAINSPAVFVTHDESYVNGRYGHLAQGQHAVTYDGKVLVSSLPKYLTSTCPVVVQRQFSLHKSRRADETNT